MDKNGIEITPPMQWTNDIVRLVIFTDYIIVTTVIDPATTFMQPSSRVQMPDNTTFREGKEAH